MQVALETVSVSGDASVTVTVTSLFAVSDWSLVSLDHAEQKSLTSIWAEYTIVIVSPC